MLRFIRTIPFGVSSCSSSLSSAMVAPRSYDQTKPLWQNQKPPTQKEKEESGGSSG